MPLIMVLFEGDEKEYEREDVELVGVEGIFWQD
jgi:hypothetical protein